MKSLDELILNRRSIRKYKPAIPSNAEIEQLLLAARQAPSPSNSQPVRFYLLQSASVKEKLQQQMEAGYEALLQKWEDNNCSRKVRNFINAYWRFSQFMSRAPLLFAVGTTEYNSFNNQLINAGIIDSNPRPQTDADISVGISLANFSLKAEELGMGSCILTAPFNFITNLNNIPELENLNIKAFITAGYPDEEPTPTTRKEIDEIYRVI